jgi:hypothetical protein
MGAKDSLKTTVMLNAVKHLYRNVEQHKRSDRDASLRQHDSRF